MSSAEVDVDKLIAELWPRGDAPESPQVHAIVDAARDPRIVGMIRETGLEHTCLFSGPLSPSLQAAAPYLVHLAPDVRFTRELFTLGWNDAWCVLVVAPPFVTLQLLRRHLRTLLRVRDEDGRSWVFRFYDPRVLRVYLPACTRSEMTRVLGPVESFVCAGRGRGSVLRFRTERTLNRRQARGMRTS